MFSVLGEEPKEEAPPSGGFTAVFGKTATPSTSPTPATTPSVPSQPSTPVIPLPVPQPIPAAPTAPFGVSQRLFERARAALDAHRIYQRDFIGIADFSLPSSEPRFHVVDLRNGQVESYRVAHGQGSDPNHNGWLDHFSNDFGSHGSGTSPRAKGWVLMTSASTCVAFTSASLTDLSRSRKRKLPV
jgi:hypothetical protein